MREGLRGAFPCRRRLIFPERARLVFVGHCGCNNGIEEISRAMSCCFLWSTMEEFSKTKNISKATRGTIEVLILEQNGDTHVTKLLCTNKSVEPRNATSVSALQSRELHRHHLSTRCKGAARLQSVRIGERTRSNLGTKCGYLAAIIINFWYR
jgi:hypothetical protein